MTCTKVSVVPENPTPLPDFTRWPSFPFEGDMRIKQLAAPVAVEPPRSGEDANECVACNTADDAYIWVSERWRVRAMDRPTGLPMVLILECRSHYDLGDLPNLLAAELGVMTVRLERAIRSLDGVARVHVNRWGDGSAHLHMWFLARPYGRLQLRGTFLSLWDDILPTIPERQWRENLALVAAWLADFGGQANAEPAHIQWESPLTFTDASSFSVGDDADAKTSGSLSGPGQPLGMSDDDETRALPTVIEPAAPGPDMGPGASTPPSQGEEAGAGGGSDSGEDKGVPTGSAARAEAAQSAVQSGSDTTPAADLSSDSSGDPPSDPTFNSDVERGGSGEGPEAAKRAGGPVIPQQTTRGTAADRSFANTEPRSP